MQQMKSCHLIKKKKKAILQCAKRVYIYIYIYIKVSWAGWGKFDQTCNLLGGLATQKF